MAVVLQLVWNCDMPLTRTGVRGELALDIAVQDFGCLTVPILAKVYKHGDQSAIHGAGRKASEIVTAGTSLQCIQLLLAGCQGWQPRLTNVVCTCGIMSAEGFCLGSLGIHCTAQYAMGIVNACHCAAQY
jgi:hypothetical protein